MANHKLIQSYYNVWKLGSQTNKPESTKINSVTPEKSPNSSIKDYKQLSRPDQPEVLESSRSTNLKAQLSTKHKAQLNRRLKLARDSSKLEAQVSGHMSPKHIKPIKD